MKTCICAIAKWEELYIREWIEHHKNIGIDHIIIADNNEPDYENPLQPIIQDYIDAGYVEVIDYTKYDRTNKPPQQHFYNYIYNINENNQLYDWIFFIDIDEFIELPAYNNDIKLFLSDKKFKDADIIIFPWLMYGDNEQLYYEDKPLKERFTSIVKYKYNNDNKVGCKSCYKKSLSFKYKKFKISSVHSPQNKFINRNNVYNSLGENNFEVVNKKINTIDISKNCYEFNHLIYNKKYYKTAYIAHYITKSTEEYIKYKILRKYSGSANYDSYNKEIYYKLNKITNDKNKLFKKLLNS